MTQKLCRDCKHYRPTFLLGSELAKCEAIAGPDYLVNGRDRQYCAVARQYDITDCGPSARLWEAKPPRRGWFRAFLGGSPA